MPPPIRGGGIKNKLCARPPQYGTAPCKLTLSSYLFARWHLLRHICYLRHQQQVDLWPFDRESGVRVTCDVCYFCANFSLPIGLSVLELSPMYATDVRQTDVRHKHRLMLPLYGGRGIIRTETDRTVSARHLSLWALVIEKWRLGLARSCPIRVNFWLDGKRKPE